MEGDAKNEPKTIQDSSEGKTEAKNVEDPSNENTTDDDVKTLISASPVIKEIKEENAEVNGVEENSSLDTGYTIHESADAAVKSDISPDEIAAAGIPVGLGDIETGNADIKSEPGFKIFVGGLDDSVTEEVLRTFIIKETKCNDDDVQSVNITCQIVKNSKKYGIAFVDFTKEETYKVALTLNNTSFKGSTIHVLPSHKTHEGIMFMDGTPTIKEEPTCSVKEEFEKPKDAAQVPVYKKSDHVAYIKNLPHGVNEDEVLEFFNFTRADVVDMAIPIPFRAKRNAKRPMRAIIAFPTEELLQKCLLQTKTMFRDREVIVERHQMVTKVNPGEKRPASCGEGKDGGECGASPEKQPRMSSAKANSSGGQSSGQLEMDLFVKHIPREASDRQIKDFFNSAGATVTKVNLFSESVTGSTRGMGFVSMFNKESVKKGLLLDCKRFYKNKVRVAVRRDRDHLVQLDPADAIPNYSTFVSNLPIREKPEVLKQVVLKHFEIRGKCEVKEVHVPVPTNRSGNRGYAFIIFENEASLKDGQGLNNTFMKLENGNTKISVSDRWPESPSSAGGGFDKLKGRTVESAPVPELPGKLRKRKKGPLPPLGGPPPESVFQAPVGRPGPANAEGFDKAPHWNGPPRPPTNGPPFGQEPPEYYLDYLEYRDYVALRKAFEDRRDFIEMQSRSRFRAAAPDDFVRPERDAQVNALAVLPRNVALQKDAPPELEAAVGRGRGRGAYPLAFEERAPAVPNAGGGRGDREYRDLEAVVSRRSGAPGVFCAAGPDPGGFSDSGARGDNAMCAGIGARGSGGSMSFVGSERGGSFSESFASSLNSSRYQTADSSVSRSRLFDDSVVSTSTLGFSRDSNSFLDSSNGVDNDRGGGNSRFSSGFSSGKGDNIRGFPSSMSNVRSGVLESARPHYESSSYSDHDRGNSYGSGVDETNSFSSKGGGSHSGRDKRYPYSSRGERRFSEYSDLGDQPQRKPPSQYDIKSDSRFESSSNSAYDVYSAMGGYRVG